MPSKSFAKMTGRRIVGVKNEGNKDHVSQRTSSLL